MTSEKAVNFLSECNGNVFVDIMTKVLANRTECISGNGLDCKLVLCEATRLSDRKSKYDDGWQFSVIADMDTTKFSRDTEGEPFLQGGACKNCGVEVCSHVKIAICPLCGDSVGCT